MKAQIGAALLLTAKTTMAGVCLDQEFQREFECKNGVEKITFRADDGKHLSLKELQAQNFKQGKANFVELCKFSRENLKETMSLFLDADRAYNDVFKSCLVGGNITLGTNIKRLEITHTFSNGDLVSLLLDGVEDEAGLKFVVKK